MTVLFSGTKYLTANLYFLRVWAIQVLIEGEIQSNDLSIQHMETQMKPKFDKYWEDYCPILSIAIVLDPRYKLNFVCYAYEMVDITTCQDKVEELTTRIQHLFDVYLGSSPLESRGVHTSTTGGNFDMHNDLLAGFDARESQVDVTINQSQLELYLAEPRIDRHVNLDVLDYWRRSKYKELAQMARDVLSIPITTIASESALATGVEYLESIDIVQCQRMLKQSYVEAIGLKLMILKTKKTVRSFQQISQD